MQSISPASLVKQNEPEEDSAMNDGIEGETTGHADNRRQFLRNVALAGSILGVPQAVSAAVPTPVKSTARDTLFDSGWKFRRGDASGAEAPPFNDRRWRVLDLPHD